VNSFVIDASVAAKWCLHESGESLISEAFRLLDRYGREEVRLIVPDFFWAEIGNVLWKAVRVKRCSRVAAETSMAEMKQRNFPTVPSELLIEEALGIAVTFDRTVYDSIYVALAVHSHGQLVTADERLANALASRFPVKWLGAI